MRKIVGLLQKTFRLLFLLFKISFILWCWYPAKLLYELLTIDQDSLGCEGWGCSYAVGWLGLVMLVKSSIFIMIGTVLIGLEWKNKIWISILWIATFIASIPLLFTIFSMIVSILNKKI